MILDRGESMHPEEIGGYAIETEAPWGSTILTWTSGQRLEFTYVHRHDATLGVVDCDPLWIVYARSRFAARMYETPAGTLSRIDVSHLLTNTMDGRRSARSDGRHYVSKDLEHWLEGWLHDWLFENPIVWERSSAVFAHDFLVRLYHRDGYAALNQTSFHVRRALRRIRPCINWIMATAHPAARQWAFVSYVPLCNRRAGRSGDMRDGLRPPSVSGAP